MRRFAPITGLDPEAMAGAKVISGVETIPPTPIAQTAKVMSAYWSSIRSADQIVEGTKGGVSHKGLHLPARAYYTDKELTRQEQATIVRKAKVQLCRHG